MTVEFYQDLMQQLGESLDLNFNDDSLSRGMARIDYANNLSTNIRYEEKNEIPYILLLAELGNIPPGAYRERLFKAVLIENFDRMPLDAIFSYSVPQDTMITYLYIPIDNLTVDDLRNQIDLFNKKSLMWKDSISRSEIPASAKEAPSGPVGMFGL